MIFADEPTGALDSLNGERVMQLLTEAARSDQRRRRPGHARGAGGRVLRPRDRRTRRQVAGHGARRMTCRPGGAEPGRGTWRMGVRFAVRRRAARAGSAPCSPRVGVGLGVALLLLAAAVPQRCLSARDDREDARGRDLVPRPTAVRPPTRPADRRRRDTAVPRAARSAAGCCARGRRDARRRRRASRSSPAPGEMVVSPALAELLDVRRRASCCATGCRTRSVRHHRRRRA